MEIITTTKNKLIETHTDDIDNYKCAICWELMSQPSKLNCNHYFCFFCISQHISFQENQNELKCPICRISLPKKCDFNIDYKLQKKIKEKFPILFDEAINLSKKLMALKKKNNILTIENNSKRLLENDLKYFWSFSINIKNCDDIKNFEKIILIFQFEKLKKKKIKIRKLPFFINGINKKSFLAEINVFWKTNENNCKIKKINYEIHFGKKQTQQFLIET